MSLRWLASALSTLAGLPGLIAAQPSPSADIFQSEFGWNPREQIWSPTLPVPPVPLTSPQAISGAMASPGSPSGDSGSAGQPAGLPVCFAVVSAGRDDLIHKQGEFHFDQDLAQSGLRFGLSPISNIDFRFEVIKSRTEEEIGNSAASLDLDKSEWDWRMSIAYVWTPYLIPFGVVQGSTAVTGENSAANLGLRGSFPCGLRWMWSTETSRSDFPAELQLTEYKAMSMPMLSRARTQSLAVGFSRGRIDAEWAGQLRKMDYARLQSSEYALGDSGSSWRQELRVTYSGGRAPGNRKVTLDLSASEGDHALHGTALKPQGLYLFSYQDGTHSAYSARLDAQAGREAWEAGGDFAAAQSLWRANRPDVAYGKHLWDRNGVLDSYAGSLLGLFDDETWLFDGMLEVQSMSAGAWAAWFQKNWRLEIALAYHRLDLRSEYRLTRRTTSFLIAYEEKESDRTFPELAADIVTPELRLARSWGPVTLRTELSQALPIRVQLLRGRSATAGSGSSGTPSGSQFSGGLRAGAELGWACF